MHSLRTGRAAFSRLLNNPLAQNSAALYGVQICRKIFPLISVPYLARTLNPAGWGTVAFVLSMGELVALLIEFGFNLSATREISRERENHEACRDIMAGVLGAQAMLAVAGVSLALLAAPHIPLLRGNPHLLVAGLLYAIAQGMTPLWFFQGLERLRLAAGLEVSAKAVMLAALFVFVHVPSDAWKAVILQAAASGFSTVAGIGLAFYSFSFRMPTPALVEGAVRRGWPMFVFRSAESLYGIANAFVLGMFAAPAVVGYFASAEKISKAVFGLLSPVRDALYPRLSYLAASSERAAARLARTGIAFMTVGGAFLALILCAAAPWVIRILAGPEFAPAVPVLRVMAALPLLLSVTYSVGLQWLLPVGREKDVNRIILSGACLNLTLAFLCAPRFGAMGMAVSVLSAELFVATSMVLVVWRSTNLLRRWTPGTVSSLAEMDGIQ